MTLKEEKIQPVVVPIHENQVLSNRVALITGGSGGIGYAIAMAFVESGANVVITGTNEVRLSELVSLANSDHIHYIVQDLSDINAMDRILTDSAALYGKKSIDILVNCAGVINKHDFLEIDEFEYDNIMQVNAKATFFMCQKSIRMMLSQNVQGHILNITSSSALRPAWTPYQMSKWAVRGLTVGLADLFTEKGIIINAIGPGQTATRMAGIEKGDSIYNSTNPSGRFATPEEIANLAVFLASDMGNMIVGDTVYMTGGSGITTMHR